MRRLTGPSLFPGLFQGVFFVFAACFILTAPAHAVVCKAIKQGSCGESQNTALNYDSTNNTFVFCNGTNWISMDGGDDPNATTCTTAGELKYDATNDNYTFCNGTDWRIFPKSDTIATCDTGGSFTYNSSRKAVTFCDGSDTVNSSEADTHNIGDECDDGTVYAGLSGDGNVEMFVPHCDQGMTWDEDAGCTGTRSALSWNDGSTKYGLVGASSSNDGDGNTTTIAEYASTNDQSHEAAQACDRLSSNDYDDWYLPASGELAVLKSNQDSIGGFHSSGGNPSHYWSSTEVTSSQVRYTFFGSGPSSIGWTKNQALSVRCARHD